MRTINNYVHQNYDDNNYEMSKMMKYSFKTADVPGVNTASSTSPTRPTPTWPTRTTALAGSLQPPCPP